jgi:hypothetical protein
MHWCLFPSPQSCLLLAELDVIPDTVDSIEQMLQASCSCYQKALSLETHDQQKSNLQRRLGNIHNELGVLYMNLAAGNVILTEWFTGLTYVGSSLLFSLVNKSLSESRFFEAHFWVVTQIGYSQ